MFSAREADGSPRVLYGALPAELRVAEPAATGGGPAEARRMRDRAPHAPTDASRGLVMLAVLWLCLFLAVSAMFVRP
jgi:hypothetical protein